MLVYLIRHGESTANRDAVPCGWGEWPLTEKGVEQAKAVGEELRKLPPFDKIYVSDLLRTRQTFEHAFGHIDHILCPLIREVNCPFVGQPLDELYEKYGEPYRRARVEMDYGNYGAETAEMMRRRIRFFQQEFLEKDTESKRVAVVCHGGVIRAFLAAAMNQDIPKVNVRVDNCSVSIFEYKDDLWRLIQFNHTPALFQPE